MPTQPAPGEPYVNHHEVSSSRPLSPHSALKWPALCSKCDNPEFNKLALIIPDALVSESVAGFSCGATRVPPSPSAIDTAHFSGPLLDGNSRHPCAMQQLWG